LNSTQKRSTLLNYKNNSFKSPAIRKSTVKVASKLQSNNGNTQGLAAFSACEVENVGKDKKKLKAYLHEESLC